MDAKSLRAKAPFVIMAAAAVAAALMLAMAGPVQQAKAEEAAQPVAQAAGSWTASGTCEWQLDPAGNALTIRPANGAATGELTDKPWDQMKSTVRSIVFEGDRAISFKGNTFQFFANCTALERIDLSGLDTSNMTDMDFMFTDCSSLKELDLSSFDTSHVTSMMIMFSGCSSLERIDLSSFDTSHVTHMNNMFRDCSSLKTLDITAFDTSNVVDMSIMFSGCSSLTSLDLSRFSTASATSFEEFFGGCSSLASIDLGSFNTRNATSLWAMFRDCSSLKELDLTPLDTSKVNIMSYLFSGCSSLERVDLSGFNTAKVDNMDSLFAGCSSLRILDISSFDTSSVVSSEDLLPVNLEQVSLGAAFTLQSSIPAGTWVNSAGKSFAAADIPQGVADTYTRSFTGPTQPQSVKIQAPASSTILVGSILSLNAVVTPSGTNVLTWSSSDNGVATVDGHGLVTAVAPGTAVISVKAGSVSDSLTITVAQRVQSIQISDASKTVLVTDAPFALTATVLPAGAINNAVVWSSSDNGVATVSPAGIVTPLSVGSATITASAGGLTAQCVVTVQAAGNNGGNNTPTPNPPTSISLNQSAKTMTVGDEPFTLVATVSSSDGSEEVSWESSDPRVATVDAGGAVRPLRTGTASIMASAGSAHQACAITVDAKNVEASSASGLDGHLVIDDAAVVAELDGLQLQINDSSRAHEQALVQAVLGSAPANSVYVGAFEVDMTDDAGAVQPWTSAAGSVQVHIALPEEAAAIAEAYDLSVHYVDDAAQTTEAKTTWMEDGNLVFETSHFSTYGLAATPRADGQGPLQNNTSVGGEPTGGGSGLAQTGDANARILFALLSLALAGAAAAGAARLFGPRGKRS